MTDPLSGLVRAWLSEGGARIADAAEELTRLDAAIGDGDHGINLARGMAAVASELDAGPADRSGAELLVAAGRRLISVVGGASGPLYGTLLLESGTRLREASTDLPGLILALEEGVAAVGRRGRSTTGQKTMLDALVPGVAALGAAPPDATPAEAGAAAAEAARRGRDATADLVAQRGRASYLGERSRGHVDPGAASSAILLEALAAALAAQEMASPAGTSR